jgi:TetR/AcrR family fatty acid metabolism transcriptional regulator
MRNEGTKRRAVEPKPEAARDESGSARKKQILRAAVEVFAERGFHRTRVSDIARRAGVAYGLIYHYFDSKDAVLGAVFEENWAVFLKVLRDIAQAKDKPSAEKLIAIAHLLIDALRINPALVQVIIQEVSRSDRYVHSKKLEAFQEAFAVIRGIIVEGQSRGELKRGIDPLVGAYIFFGALETICTGFTLKAIPCSSEADAERLKKTVTTALLSGMLE